ncbi:hypothetical protein GPALN_006580 [Globodera pallida]|nr:hypothetical protein GPALN_006580 [Globodera pallida]
MSHWVWHNVWQVSSNGWGGECDYCLNYDAQTCSLVFLSLGLALLFFGWLFFQMIRKTLSVKNGASREAILKFIMENFDVGSSQARANGYLNKALTRAVASGDQKQVLQSDRSAPILPNLRSKESVNS